MPKMTGPSFTDDPEYERADLISEGMDGTATREVLRQMRLELASVPPDEFSALRLKRALVPHIGDDGEEVAKTRTLSVVIAGNAHLHNIYGVMETLGKERVLQRLDLAILELSVVAQ